jgi:hypothetical protein
MIKIPLCILNIQNPREIKRITTTNAEIDAISATGKLFFLQDFVLQRPELSLSSTLKGSQKCLNINFIRKTIIENVLFFNIILI